jgi:hypothetical protein
LAAYRDTHSSLLEKFLDRHRATLALKLRAFIVPVDIRKLDTKGDLFLRLSGFFGFAYNLR